MFFISCLPLSSKAFTWKWGSLEENQNILHHWTKPLQSQGALRSDWPSKGRVWPLPQSPVSPAWPWGIRVGASWTRSVLLTVAAPPPSLRPGSESQWGTQDFRPGPRRMCDPGQALPLHGPQSPHLWNGGRYEMIPGPFSLWGVGRRQARVWGHQWLTVADKLPFSILAACYNCLDNSHFIYLWPDSNPHQRRLPFAHRTDLQHGLQGLYSSQDPSLLHSFFPSSPLLLPFSSLWAILFHKWVSFFGLAKWGLFFYVHSFWFTDLVGLAPHSHGHTWSLAPDGFTGALALCPQIDQKPVFQAKNCNQSYFSDIQKENSQKLPRSPYILT